MHSYALHDSQHRQEDDEERAARADERQWQARNGHEADRHRDVDVQVAEDKGCCADDEESSPVVSGHEGDPNACEQDAEEEREHGQRAHEA